MLCGGHVARSFTKSLGEQKSFLLQSKTSTGKHFQVFMLSSVVAPKNCGCLSKFYCLLHGDATKDPEAFASCLTVLGKYHA